MSNTEEAQAKAMRALLNHLLALQVRVDKLTCDVEALRQMLPPERYREFEQRVAQIRQDAEKAGDEAEANERLRQMAADVDTPES